MSEQQTEKEKASAVNAGVEADRLSLPTIWFWVAGTTLFVILSTVGVRQLYIKMWQAQMFAARLETVDVRLDQGRIPQRAQIEEYKLVTVADEKDPEAKPRYQVPVTVAMKAIAENAALLEPLREAAPLADPAPSAQVPADTSGEGTPAAAAGTAEPASSGTGVATP